MLQLLTYQQTVGVLFIVLSAMGNDVVYFMVILLVLTLTLALALTLTLTLTCQLTLTLTLTLPR